MLLLNSPQTNNETGFIPLYFAAIFVRFWRREYVAASSQVHMYGERAPSRSRGQSQRLRREWKCREEKCAPQRAEAHRRDTTRTGETKNRLVGYISITYIP